ncbi:hypothetical protein BASA50_004925 [Batrachochytrium salamandrivorans]|uniref:Sulfhydryl oxidase n=1 Tax=Batrachochytrium salamandrivorans TaxID=1357716 RepID=A0ABQ8FEQ3_9FUNG|nr:hypothetical protein BASA60_011082 [Batrachochytrium salamandrivorans]KAH6564340.1 hypothetical protein BASA60_010363 [Batrachochytrium salamandrivorans]KAH6585397.1 hypothetical protein BASA61_006859 [Batrachochytrium salamandrivorans]KAH6596779.1 hypothetical protein BASA50_004925 [Batrachochytrium salamandrivorans]KAH9267144.1 hypothetical protein BASA83_010172 [Batrachochytrium salamandrivorans]
MISRRRLMSVGLVLATAFLLMVTFASITSDMGNSINPSSSPAVYGMRSLVPSDELDPMQDRPLTLWESIVSGAKTPERLPGKVIMGKLGNETLKAELGQSAWRLLHTMAGKFPYSPTSDEQNALRDFIYLFARLYPCGECAAHFKVVLENHPPIVTNRTAVSQWACQVHNVVNLRLEKPMFDCALVAKTWKCGCDDDEEETVDPVDAKNTSSTVATSTKSLDSNTMSIQ